MQDLQIEQITCTRCEGPMPKIRLEKFGYRYCVKCSTEQPKVALNVVHGEGDHTWNDIIVLDSEVAREIALKEARLLNKTAPLDLLDPSFEEEIPNAIIKESISKIFKDDPMDDYKDFSPIDTECSLDDPEFLEIEEDLWDEDEDMLHEAEE